MKRILYAVFLLPLVGVFIPATAKAHVLQTNGGIGAILHVQPDDNPQSGTPVRYTLAFTDTTGRFTLPGCDCTMTVRENGAAVSAGPLATTHDTESTNTVTFPKPAVYTLEVTGRPKAGRDFTAFTLSYTVRVTSDSVQVQRVPLSLWIGMTGAIGLILLAAYATESGQAAERQKK